MSDPFWQHIDLQILQLRSAETVDEVLAICPHIPDLGAGDGFFEGSGGDDQVEDALHDAGWTFVTRRATYYWCMRAPNGDLLSYVEGDLYRGNKLAEWEDR